MLQKEKEIEKQHVRCDELQMLKFGQLINISELDKISVNSEEIELMKKTEALEVTNEREVYQMQAKHRKLKEKLLDVTQINTSKLNQIAEMNGRQFFLEKELFEFGAEKSACEEAVEIAGTFFLAFDFDA